MIVGKRVKHLYFILLIVFSLFSVDSSKSATIGVPAMLSSPPKGVAGPEYIVGLFTQVCLANRANMERITHILPLPGWHSEFIGKDPMLKISTGRVDWPLIETKKQSYGAICAVVWTIDPNQGVGSIQAELERATHLTLNGQRVTTAPNQTVFTGSGGCDKTGLLCLTLNENISEKRASFQIIIDGKWN